MPPGFIASGLLKLLQLFSSHLFAYLSFELGLGEASSVFVTKENTFSAFPP